MHVLLTHATTSLLGLAAKLQQLGHTVSHQPLISTQPLEGVHLAPLEGCVGWCISSKAAVDALVALGATFNRPLAAVGPATAHALTQAGAQQVWVPEVFSGASMALELAQRFPEGTIGLPTGNRNAGTVQQGLQAVGRSYLELQVYRTLTHALPSVEGIQAMVLGSPSAFDVAKVHNLEGVRLVALGQTTAQHIQQHGYSATVASPTVQSIAQVLS